MPKTNRYWTARAVAPRSSAIRNCSRGRFEAFVVSATLLLAPSAAFAQCNGFAVTQSTGALIVPGVTDIGNHCDDCTTNVTLPFPVSLYGATYSSARISSNGNVQFTTNDGAYSNDCLPQAGTLGVAICPHWDDHLTDGANEGIFTSVSGSPPQRVFNIEWRCRYYSGGGSLNFELRLFEDNSHFEVIYGRLDEDGANATVGVQHPSLPATQYSCNNAGVLSSGMRLSFACYNGPTGTATAFPNPVYACEDDGVTLLTVNVTPGSNPPSTGIAVQTDLSSIGGSANQAFFNNGTNGDETAGDGVWSFEWIVPELTAAGDKNIPYTLSDAQGRSTTGALALTVNPCASTGPDVIVRNLTDVNYYGAMGNVSAYAIGTDACNIGDFPALWIQGGTQHPVIAQNMYRLMNGRFEQIGQSFLKHGFQSLNSPGCGTCVQPPLGGAQLGVGCSDVYGAGYNGSQGNLGRRSTCNATTGAYSWPPPPPPPAADVLGQRLQVFTADINPALNPGAQYFGEAQYVTADDAQWSQDGAPARNGLNNASYQRLSFSNTTSAPTIVGPPQLTSPAIRAWKDVDPSVSINVADYVDNSLPGPGIVCRFWVAAKATDNGDGTWHYEYAVFNLNSDRAGGGFIVPVSRGVTVSNIGFHGVFSHSGEPYPNTATNPANWIGAPSDNSVRWVTAESYLPPNGDNANALRWGTLYNFRFDADVAPRSGDVSVVLFKPGDVQSAEATAIVVPGIPGDVTGDGHVDLNDLALLLTAFGTCSSDAGFNAAADVNGNGCVELTDLATLLSNFGL
ncbi:MAG: dockerin type I domain-containing protein [Phycisphaerae bacterium]